MTSSVKLRVPPTVKSFWEFRHSEAPVNDCSRSGMLGPYTGRQPICFGDTACTDYDYSLAPDQRFGGLYGAMVGHCDVPRVAAEAVLALTEGRNPPRLPPARPVERKGAGAYPWDAEF